MNAFQEVVVVRTFECEEEEALAIWEEGGSVTLVEK